MFNLIEGVKIKNPDGLSEGYVTKSGAVQALVDKNNIGKVIKNFIKYNQKNRLFFFMEVPSDQKGYKDIFYKYPLTSDDAIKIFELSEDILVNDGITSFGFGCKATNMQIGKYAFNEMWLQAPDSEIAKCVSIFERLGIKENKNLTTPADIISEYNPGYTYIYEDSEGHTIQDHLNALISIGLMKVNTVKA